MDTDQNPNKVATMQQLETSEQPSVVADSMKEVKEAAKKPRKPRVKKTVESPIITVDELEDLKAQPIWMEGTKELMSQVPDDQLVGYVAQEKIAPKMVTVDEVIAMLLKEALDGNIAISANMVARIATVFAGAEVFTKEEAESAIKEIINNTKLSLDLKEQAEIDARLLKLSESASEDMTYGEPYQKDDKERLARITKKVKATIVNQPAGMQERLIQMMVNDTIDSLPKPESYAKHTEAISVPDKKLEILGEPKLLTKDEIRPLSNHERNILSRAKKLGMSVLDYLNKFLVGE